MAREPQSKDEALDALDFIVNVLKEHEKDLDKLISELGTVTAKIGAASEIGGKMEKLEQKINGLQSEITNLVTYLATSHRETPLVIQEKKSEPIAAQKAASVQPLAPLVRPVILRCKQWDDFQNLAFQSRTLSFIFKEVDKTFQVQALKDNEIITYVGALPKSTELLKMWLSKQLDVSEKRILEGILAIG